MDSDKIHYKIIKIVIMGKNDDDDDNNNSNNNNNNNKTFCMSNIVR